MPGGDYRHPRKTGSGVRAGGQSLPDQNRLPSPTYARKTQFSRISIPTSFYKLFSVTVVFLSYLFCDLAVWEPGSSVAPFIHLALHFRLVIGKSLIPEIVQPAPQSHHSAGSRAVEPAGPNGLVGDQASFF